MVIRILILIFFISIASCSKSQFHFIKRGATAKTLSITKNIRSLVDSPAYESFGFPVQNQSNQVTYYYRRGITHTTGGNPYYRTLNIATGTWSNPVLIHSDSIDSRDVSGGVMDNDSTILFYARNHTDVYHSRDIYTQKCDLSNHFSSRVLFDFTGVTHLQGGFFWGPMIKGDVNGEYYHLLYQSNSDTGSTHFRITFFKTSDYWNHYTEVGTVYDGTSQFGEAAGINLGSGKFLVVSRLSNSGSMVSFESTNFGASWTQRNANNLFWYQSGSPEIVWIYQHDGVFDIPYQCRDARMIQVSKGNTIINGTNFGTPSPVFNNPEIYSYHFGTGGNPSLGYVSELKLTTGQYLFIYGRQYNNNRANLQWTYDDLTTDEAGIPVAPTITTGTITTTSFRSDVSTYTDKQWENIRYLSQDLSTDPAFGSFVTCQYLNPSDGHPNTLMHDVRMTGWYDFYNGLTTGTTYYLRIKACNNTGCSAFTTVNITTL